jgi:hypothetical protein
VAVTTRSFREGFAVKVYGGHFKKRATVSGEYQGTSAGTYCLMQPSKYVSQNDFFSVSVPARGFRERSVRIQAATAEAHNSFLHASPVGEAEAGAAAYPGTNTGVQTIR